MQRSAVSPRRSLRALAAAAACGVLLSHCGTTQQAGPEPEVALARSAEAQAEFRSLREQWVSTPLDARPALERKLTDFVQRYPNDPQGRWVRLYLAWIRIQRQDLAIAERWLALAEPGAAGAASDLAAVVRAALDLARGDAGRAYDELLELSGRLIDADDRLLCLDQLVLAALADQRYQRAVLHMLELSAQAARRHRERLWRTLEPRLASIPLAELEASLPSLTSSAIQSAQVAPAERAAAVDWLRRTVLELLSRSALDEQNVALAQRLVASPQGGASGDDADKSELLLLATRGTLERVVQGRTLGLAIDLSDEQKSQRSIDVATGIALTLDLASPSRGPDPLVLTTRHVEDGDMGDALARLAGDGASLLVAGLDAEGASQAAAFAAQSGIAVLLLHEPGDPPQPAAALANAFVLGGGERAASEVLYAALEQRFPGVVRVGSDEVPCPSDDLALTALLAELRSGGRRLRLEFDGSAGCARNVLIHARDGARPLVLGFGLDALGVAWEAPLADEIWAVGAGRLPSFDAPRDELAAVWFARRGRPPTWYEALGHDAARIAALALGPGPKSVLRDADAVRAAHRAVHERLRARAIPDLWTTDAARFDAGRRLPRAFRAQRLEPSAGEPEQ